MATVAFIVIAAAFVGPLFFADSDAEQADDLVRANKIYEAIPLYAHAAQLIPYNADYPLRQAEALLFINAPHWEIDTAISSAISDDPRSVEAYLLRARYLQRQPNPDTSTIIAAYQDALHLNPNDVGIRLEFADFLRITGKSQDAAPQYQKALWFNDQFPAEEAKRLPPAQVDQIQQTIAQLASHP